MSIEAIVFDKDGTLIDFGATFAPATRNVLRELSGGDPEVLENMNRALKFDPEVLAFATDSVVIAGTGLDIAEALFPFSRSTNVLEFAFEIDEAYGRACLETVEPIDGVASALKKLSDKGLVLGVATNDAEANARAQLATLGFEDFFPLVFGADSGHGGKPEPGMVTAFVEQSGFSASAVIMVGDSSHDAEAGRRAGARTVGVETGPADKQELERHFDVVLPSVTALPGHLALFG